MQIFNNVVKSIFEVPKTYFIIYFKWFFKSFVSKSKQTVHALLAGLIRLIKIVSFNMCAQI